MVPKDPRKKEDEGNTQHIGNEDHLPPDGYVVVDISDLGATERLNELASEVQFVEEAVGKDEEQMKVYITNSLKLDILPDRLLHNLARLHSVRFANSCQAIKKIGHGFLFGCPSLREMFGVFNLTSITHIGSFFCSGCANLETLHLEHLKAVTCIENGFLAGCTSLKNFNCFTAAPGCKIGDFFLMNCSRLCEVRPTSSLAEVVEIGKGFLVECNQMPVVNLRPLVKVHTVGTSLLKGCALAAKIQVTTQQHRGQRSAWAEQLKGIKRRIGSMEVYNAGILELDFDQAPLATTARAAAPKPAAKK